MFDTPKQASGINVKTNYSKVIFVSLIILSFNLLGQCKPLLTQIHNQSAAKKQQTINLNDDSFYYLISQINLRQEGGFMNTFTSLEYKTSNNHSIISVSSNNRVIVFVCSNILTNCTKGPNIQIKDSISIQASALSDDCRVLALGGSNGKVYVYMAESQNTGTYYLKGIINDSLASIKSVRINQGLSLYTGGADKIARYYIFDPLSPTQFQLNQTFTAVPSQIIGVSNLYVFQNQNYLFIAYLDGIKTYLFNKFTGKYQYKYQLNVTNVAVIESTISGTLTGDVILAVGTHYATVKLFQYANPLTPLKEVQQINSQNLGDIISICFTQNGEFLVIGNHNQETYIYKRKVQNNGSYFWQIFQTLKFSSDIANFMKVAKFKPDGTFLATGSDDLFLRLFTFGTCQPGTNFDGYGRCQKASYWWIFLIAGLIVVFLSIFAFIFFKRKIKVPVQSRLQYSSF